MKYSCIYTLLHRLMSTVQCTDMGIIAFYIICIWTEHCNYIFIPNVSSDLKYGIFYILMHLIVFVFISYLELVSMYKFAELYNSES